MTFNADTCTWNIAGEVSDVRTSSERKAIIAAINETQEPMHPGRLPRPHS